MGEGHHAVLGSYGQGALYDALELNHIPADWLNEAEEAREGLVQSVVMRVSARMTCT